MLSLPSPAFLRPLLIAGLLILCCATAWTAPDAAPLRLLLVGLDGADWQIAEPLVAAGKLPNLARLRSGGAWGDLRSATPMLSPLLWTSIATGKPPDKHGIIDFLVIEPRTGQKVPISSTFRKTRALWNIYSDAGRTVDFVAWWATWPAETVRGHMISERLAYSLFGYRPGAGDSQGLVYPPAYLDDIASLRVDESAIRLEDLARFGRFTQADLDAARAKLKGDPAQAYADPINHLTRILASTRTYHAIALKLLREGPADLTSVYYQGIDEVCHRFAQYIAPRPSWVDPGLFEKYRDVVPRFYEYQDELLGELLKAAGPAMTVMLISDHGFLNGSDRPGFPPDIELKAGEWHRQYGVLVMKGPGVRPGRLDTSSIYDITPTLLYLSGLPVAADMTGRPLLDAVAPEFRAKTSLTTVPSYEDAGGRRAGSEAAVGTSSELNEEMLAKLRSLGYISGSDGGAPVLGQETPATLTNMLNMASLEIQKGDFVRAEEILRSILQRKPDHANTHSALSEVLERQGRLEESLAEARTALNQVDEPAERLVERFARLSRRLRVLDDARSYFLRAIQLKPGRAEPWLGLGLAQSYSGDLKGAQQSLTRALEMNPKSTAAVTGLFNVYERGGRAPETLAAIEKSVAANPDSAAHHTLLGLIYMNSRDAERALSELKRALQLDPERDATIAALGDLMLNSGRVEEARRLLEQAISRKGDQVEVRMALGRTYAKLGRMGEASRQMSEAARLDPDNASAHAQVGMLLMMQGQPLKAAPILERALDLEPSLYELHLHLAIVYHDQKRSADCERHLKAAIEQRPRDPEPHRLLASLYEETGRQEESARELALVEEITKGP